VNGYNWVICKTMFQLHKSQCIEFIDIVNYELKYIVQGCW